MTKLRTHILILVYVLLSADAAVYIGCSTGGASSTQTVRFASEIQSLLEEDQLNPPPKRGILFIGSSIFKRWTHLTEQMAPLPVFNRAFGGSRTDDLLYYMDKIVFPYEPTIIVYYCGSNDINASAEPEDIFARFKQFSERVNEKLVNTQLYFVSINRAPQKREKWNIVDSTNALVKQYCLTTKNRWYIDVNPILFDTEGKPRLELYLEDGLHFRDQAYVEFAAKIKPILEKTFNTM
jgi:hypothetical protein